ncbi:unnamed protein product, partial [marine sediment metagenome]
PYETLGVLFSLCENETDFAEEFLSDWLYSFVCGVAFVTYSAIDHDDGNI